MTDSAEVVRVFDALRWLAAHPGKIVEVMRSAPAGGDFLSLLLQLAALLQPIVSTEPGAPALEEIGYQVEPATVEPWARN